MGNMTHSDWVVVWVGGVLMVLFVIGVGLPEFSDPKWKEWREAAKKRLRRR